MIHRLTDIHLFFIRHGKSYLNGKPEVVAGRSEEDLLTKEGIKQAEKLRKELLNVQFSAVYTSPVKRASETARIVFPKQKILVAKELTELSHGSFEGKIRSEVYTGDVLSYLHKKGYTFQPPDGESQRMVERRATGFIEDEILYNKKYLQGRVNIALVFHVMTIRCVLHWIMGFDSSLTHKISIDPASITHVSFRSDGWHIHRINSAQI